MTEQAPTARTANSTEIAPDAHESLDRFPGDGERIRLNLRDGTNYTQWALLAAPRSPLTPQWEQAAAAAAQATLDESPFAVFALTIVLSGPSLVVNFLLPIW